MSKYHNLDSNDVNINFRINLMSTSSFSDEIVVSVFEEQIKKTKQNKTKKTNSTDKKQLHPPILFFILFVINRSTKAQRQGTTHNNKTTKKATQFF